MANINWPDNLALIPVEGWTDNDEPNVRRTPFEDGAIAQAEITSVPWRVRQFEVWVYEDDVPSFRAWLRLNGSKLFNFNDPEGEDSDGNPLFTQREARLRGGAGSVQLQRVADRRLNGRRYRSGQIEIEGY